MLGRETQTFDFVLVDQHLALEHGHEIQSADPVGREPGFHGRSRLRKDIRPQELGDLGRLDRRGSLLCQVGVRLVVQLQPCCLRGSLGCLGLTHQRRLGRPPT